MGKKGKKKEKIEGTPDVVKFKTTNKNYHFLREIVNIQESLPFVSSDQLDDYAFRKVSRFLNMLGNVAEMSGVDSDKSYRFRHHHKFLSPAPQLYPCGYNAELIRKSRALTERPVIMFNRKTYPFPNGLDSEADTFLRDLDSMMTKIASFIEPNLKDHFANGLKKFLFDLKTEIAAFDTMWIIYEEKYLIALTEIYEKVYEPVESLVDLERGLTDAEDKLDIELKQDFEIEFAQKVESFTNVLFPNTTDYKFPADIIPLAEAAVFYETKVKAEWLHIARHCIKEYIELRMYIAKIPEERLFPSHHDNQRFCRMLASFHQSVRDGQEVWDHVAQLPKLIHCKTQRWLTKRRLTPEVTRLQEDLHKNL